MRHEVVKSVNQCVSQSVIICNNQSPKKCIFHDFGLFYLLLPERATRLYCIFGIIGTVVSGYLSDKLFRGDRKFPALAAGIMEAVALALFLYGGNSWAVNLSAMTLFGISIGVLIAFLGGLMAVDLVPRRATGAAIGIVGLASYVAAGLMNVISGWLIDGQAVKDVSTGEILEYDFTYVSVFWIGAAVISFLLPLLNWRRHSAGTDA